MRREILAAALACGAFWIASPVWSMATDPYLWLEEISGKRAMEWVEKENSETKNVLTPLPSFAVNQARILKILDSKEKIPYVAKHGQYYYNFWRDENHVRGLYRRTTLEQYKKANPEWEVVIDLDKLAETEKESWVWQSIHVLYHDYDRALVVLSKGGGDAVVVREFDLDKKEFVPGGFNLPEAKSEFAWRDRDTIYVATDYGAGSMTTSGYPRIIKEWKRGTALKEAATVFEGKTDDVGVGVNVAHDHGLTYEFVDRKPGFFTNETAIRRDNKFVTIAKPEDATVFSYGPQIMLELRSDWKIEKTEINKLATAKTYKAGSLLTANFDDYLKGNRNLDILFEPTARTSLENGSGTKNFFLLTTLVNVTTRSYILQNKDGQWQRRPIDTPQFSSTQISAVDEDESDDYWIRSSNLITPNSLSIGTADLPERTLLKSQPAFFNSDNLEIHQFEATSKDGTKVPYFQLNRKNLKLDGSNRTLLYGYGGFEISLLPSYDAVKGAAWVERGGVYILANIRGGGEFGPSWHEAARKENRSRAYEDFSAIARDLVDRKVTTPAHLGIDGRSNGGLLVGVMLTRYPELFGAVHCGSPLLDMQRYSHLLAGASWMAEYGDPDKAADWEYISKYSPYQNIQKDKKYPPILITTATSDDRVHPGHARKMAAKLKSLGHDVLFYENTEGGHGAASNNKQAAFMDALAYTFLWEKLL